MKTAYIFKIAMIAIVAFISMVSCSKDNDDDISTCQANAKGVCLYYDDDYVETEDYYLWINDYIVKHVAREDNIDITHRTEIDVPYQQLTMNTVYELLSEYYGEEITANTDLSLLSPNPKKLLQYIKSNKSKYTCIILRDSDFILFNRTSDKNY